MRGVVCSLIMVPTKTRSRWIWHFKKDKMMRKFVKPTLVTAALVMALSTASMPAIAAILNDAGFETQGAPVSSFCYNVACPAGAWNFDGGAGLQVETNSAWPGAPTPDGSYYAFTQNGGSFSTAINPLQTGNYLLSWLDAGRPTASSNDGNQNYSVRVFGSSGSQLLYSGSTTSFQPFTARSATTLASLVAGTAYTLEFQGLTNSGDHTAFIDALNFTFVPTVGGVPEPASWALMIAGFGLVGGAMRRRAQVRIVTA